MRNSIKIMMLFGLIILLLTGCLNDGGTEPPESEEPNTVEKPTTGDTPTSEENPATEDNTTKQEPISTPSSNQNPVNTNKPVTFYEAFPSSINGNPDQFINSILPGFSMGISKGKTKELLGEPTLIEKYQYEWGEMEDWLYEDVKGYTLVVTFNPDGSLGNFKLIKQLTGRGTIPKVTNKSVPADGSLISYNELGFEGVLLGTTVKDVINRFGEPYQTYISNDEMYGYTLALVYRGITINVFLANEDPYVQFIETNDLGSIETYRGISVGDSVYDVIEKYGEPAYDWAEAGDIVYATEDYWFGIKFHIKNEKVTSINIFEAS